MTEGQENEWHIELDYMRAQLRWVLNNLDSIEKRNDVKSKLETIYFTIGKLCEQTKGELE